MPVVRYADDIIVGFEHETDARRFQDAGRGCRSSRCRSIRTRRACSSSAAMWRPGAPQRGLGKPESCNLLGFNFVCGKSRRGRFLVERKTRRDRMQAKLKEIKEELRRRRHQPIPAQEKWLRQGRGRLLCPPCAADQRPGPGGVPLPRHESMAAHASATQPKGSDDVAAADAARRRLAPAPAHPPPWPSQRFAVKHPR
jgi:hypothetical protein